LTGRELVVSAPHTDTSISMMHYTREIREMHESRMRDPNIRELG